MTTIGDSHEQIERIVGVIRRAPSGGFSQGGSIVANESLYHARYNGADKLAATGGVEVTWPVPYWLVDAGALMHWRRR